MHGADGQLVARGEATLHQRLEQRLVAQAVQEQFALDHVVGDFAGQRFQLE